MEYRTAGVGMVDSLLTRSRVAVFFDDQLSTIEQHIEYVKQRGITAIITESEEELINTMAALWDRAVFFIDMHVPKIFDLGRIGFEAIDTLRCSAFATAIFKAFHIKYKKALKFPCILSGRELAEKANDTISDLEDEDFMVDFVRKDNFDEFQKVVDHYLSECEETDEYSRLVGKKLSVAKGIVEAWFPGEAKIKEAFFGFTNAADYLACAESNVLVTRDLEDRCDAIYRIKRNLLSVYSGDIEREQRWLNTQLEALGSRSPRDVIDDGRQHGLFRLLSILERV
jgi:hypothetical protein